MAMWRVLRHGPNFY